MTFENSADWARHEDERDELKSFRDRFIFPEHHAGEVIYFTGNSLGLQPKTARQAIEQELDDWAKYGVEGHFDAKNPWYAYHEMFAQSLARLVGTKESEVVAMNGLTSNLHFLMVSFYRPTATKFKILCEQKAFPSDQYALQSQARFRGYDPEEAIIQLTPRDGEHTVRQEDVIEALDRHADELAMVMIGGVNYYTGQVFDMQSIAAKANELGIICGFDLAHAAGNIPMHLHDWNVDFAAWCSYKYLNSGPGSVAGAFVHEKHHHEDTVRFAGWWGHDKVERFKMEPQFKPMKSAESWQLSNAPVFSMAIHKASLDIFDEAGIDNLRKKSVLLNRYLRFVIVDVASRFDNVDFEIITPETEAQHGSQLSVLVHGQGKAMFDALTEMGVIADWREPNVIRIAPVPLYNSFTDCYRFGECLANFLSS